MGCDRSTCGYVKEVEEQRARIAELEKALEGERARADGWERTQLATQGARDGFCEMANEQRERAKHAERERDDAKRKLAECEAGAGALREALEWAKQTLVEWTGDDPNLAPRCFDAVDAALTSTAGAASKAAEGRG